MSGENVRRWKGHLQTTIDRSIDTTVEYSIVPWRWVMRLWADGFLPHRDNRAAEDAKQALQLNNGDPVAVPGVKIAMVILCRTHRFTPIESPKKKANPRQNFLFKYRTDYLSSASFPFAMSSRTFWPPLWPMPL